MNSLVQSASAASPREVSPGAAAADSEPERNSAAQSPESANAATSGAAPQRDVPLRTVGGGSLCVIRPAGTGTHLSAGPV